MPNTTSPLKTISFNASETLAKSLTPIKSLKRQLSTTAVSSTNCNEGENTIKISKQEKANRPFTVSVEGNIGCGKSTFLKHFESYSNVATFPEPIDKWTNLNGSNLLGKLYENGKRWNFLFQSYVQLTRLKIHLQKPEADVKLIERSFHNNRFCFLESDYHDGTLPEAEYEVLCEYFNTFEKHMDIGVDLIVYLRTTPQIVYERMKKRGRVEEASVPLEYLEKVHKYYERWLMESLPRAPHAPVLVIDGNVDIDSLFTSCEKEIPIIFGEKPLAPTNQRQEDDATNSSPELDKDLKER